MPFDVEVARNSFSAGEVSPELRGRADLQKTQNGCWFLENMVTLLEGGVTRRPGTQMVLQLNPAYTYVGIPFRFAGSGSNAYLIVIGGGIAKFILNNGVVQAPAGGDYTVAVPYTDADLGGQGAAIAGISNLRYATSGNVVYLFCDGHPPQVLTRNADNSWTLAPYVAIPASVPPQGGCIAPVDTENLDPAQTLVASGVTGIITLTASAAFAAAAATVPNGFQAGHVGSVWRLDESDLSQTPEWAADEAIAVPTQALPAGAGQIGSMANLAGPFAGTPSDATQNGTAVAYIGENFTTPQAIYSVTVSAGSGKTFGSGISGTLTLYGGNHLPANATDGVQLATVTFGGVANQASTATLYATDALSTFSYLWVAFSFASPTNVDVGKITWTQFTAGGTPVLRRYNGNVYQALTAGNAGATPPVHTAGAVLSGQGGVDWLYVHRDRGFVLITAVVSPTQATATVIERLPDSVTVTATANWWPSAWDAIKGYPNRGAIIRNSLVTGRQSKFWFTQPGTFNNHDIVDPTSSQSAIAGQLISPSGSLAWIEWFMGGLYLGTGTRDEEWVLVGQDILSAITIQNLSPYVSHQEGSAQHIPATGESGLMVINRARDRLLFMQLAYSYFMPQYAVEELTVTARHILGRVGGGALGVSRQQDPNRISWAWTKNGLLVGNTFMRDQQVNGWHRHPQHAATQSAVTYVATIPANDEGRSLTYLFTTRTINGTVQKFVELMQPFFQPTNFFAPDATGAWFLDCALQYSGAPTLMLTGLAHLAGAQVNVHADGCMMFDPDNLPTVSATGTLALPRPASNAVAGLPIAYRIRTLPLDLSTPAGSTAGDKQKANHVILREVNAAGGAIVVNPDDNPTVPEALDEDGILTFGQPIPLRNGIKRPPGLDAPLADECVVEISGSDTMPYTLVGIDPDIAVTEKP